MIIDSNLLLHIIIEGKTYFVKRAFKKIPWNELVLPLSKNFLKNRKLRIDISDPLCYYT